MTQTILDPCLFFEKKESELIGLIGTSVDDTLGTASEEFAVEEETRSLKLDVKPRDESFPIQFGGSKISKTGKGFFLSQQTHSMTLTQIPPTYLLPKLSLIFEGN